jgi:hypothetical protein
MIDRIFNDFIGSVVDIIFATLTPSSVRYTKESSLLTTPRDSKAEISKIREEAEIPREFLNFDSVRGPSLCKRSTISLLLPTSTA